MHMINTNYKVQTTGCHVAHMHFEQFGTFQCSDDTMVGERLFSCDLVLTVDAE